MSTPLVTEAQQAALRIANKHTTGYESRGALADDILDALAAAEARGWAAAIKAAANAADIQAWAHTEIGFENGPELNSAAIASAIRALTPTPPPEAP